MIYDTLKLTKALEPAFSRDQAEAVATALVDSTLDTVATKSDIALLRADFATLRADFTALRGDFTSLKGEMANNKAEMIKWIVGAIVLNLFGTAGLVLALTKALAH